MINRERVNLYAHSYVIITVKQHDGQLCSDVLSSFLVPQKPTTQPAVQSGITEKEVPAGTIEPESAVDTIPVPGTQSEEISTRAQAKADKKAKLHEKRKLRKDNRIERRKHKKERGMK